MIHALIQGELIADPQTRTSAVGKTFVTATARVATGDEALLVGVVAFGSVADKLAALKKGDALAATGPLKPNVWTDREGNERRGWSLTAADVMTLYQLAKRKKAVQQAATASESEGFPDDPL